MKSREPPNEEKLDNTVRARLNQVFTIALDSLPSAGYKWIVEYDSSYLRMDNERYLTTRAEAIGSDIVQAFSFIPLRIGKTEVFAIYKRPWEEEVKYKRTFEILISEN